MPSLSEAAPSDADRRALLRLARQAVVEAVSRESLPENIPCDGIFSRRCGAFVTLHVQRRLRGCIGVIEAGEPLGTHHRALRRKRCATGPAFPSGPRRRPRQPANRDLSSFSACSDSLGGSRNRPPWIADFQRLSTRPAASSSSGRAPPDRGTVRAGNLPQSAAAPGRLAATRHANAGIHLRSIFRGHERRRPLAQRKSPRGTNRAGVKFQSSESTQFRRGRRYKPEHCCR